MSDGPTAAPDHATVADSGAVAFGGDVTITGAVAAGRDVIIDRLTVLVDDGPPFGDAATRPAGASDVCPYPGIAAFAERQEAFFFGRDRDRDAIVDQLRRSRFVAVVGASGTGKSSLLNAGVVPVLARDTGGADVAVLRPGADPVALFTEARDRRGANGSGRPVVWVVDQLEELFASGVGAADRAAFVELLHAEGREGSSSSIVLALRSDFYPRLEETPWLAKAVAASQHWLLPLDADAIRDIVIRPAEAVGLRVEPALLDEIARDVDPAANQLPLLAYALRETWLRRRNGWLTLAGYAEAGGLARALQQGADSVWRSLDASQRATARRLSFD